MRVGQRVRSTPHPPPTPARSPRSAPPDPPRSSGSTPTDDPHTGTPSRTPAPPDPPPSRSTTPPRHPTPAHHHPVTFTRNTVPPPYGCCTTGTTPCGSPDAYRTAAPAPPPRTDRVPSPLRRRPWPRLRGHAEHRQRVIADREIVGDGHAPTERRPSRPPSSCEDLRSGLNDDAAPAHPGVKPPLLDRELVADAGVGSGTSSVGGSTEISSAARP